MRTCSAIVACSIWAGALCAAGPAFALRPEVEAARELYNTLHYDEARSAFEQALALEENAPEDLATIYLYLGMLAGAENDEELAEEHFGRALQVQPDLELPHRLPPKITRPFARARDRWGEEHLDVSHTPPESITIGEQPQLRFAVTNDRFDMVIGARLLYSTDSSDDLARVIRQDGSGPFLFTIPERLIDQSGELRYRFELLGAASSRLSVFEPAGLIPIREAEADAPTSPPEINNAPSVPEPPPQRTPLVRRWWFWTVIGVVVTGAAVGLGVGLGVQDDGIEFGRPEVRQ